MKGGVLENGIEDEVVRGGRRMHHSTMHACSGGGAGGLACRVNVGSSDGGAWLQIECCTNTS